MENRALLLGTLTFLAVLLALFGTGVFGVSGGSVFEERVWFAGTPNERVTEGDTVQESLRECQQDRLDAISSSGDNYESCQLVCPNAPTLRRNSDGSYDFDYTYKEGYEGSYENIMCDKIPGVNTADTFYASSVLTYKAKSDGTTIRFEERQVGAGTIVTSDLVSGGVVYEVEAEFALFDNNGNRVGDPYEITKWKLECDEGSVEGKTIADNRNDLGSCRVYTLPVERIEMEFKDVEVQRDVTQDDDVQVGGQVLVEDEGNGLFYVYSKIVPQSRSPLSIVLGRGTVDVCGENEYLAGSFHENIEVGDTILFQNSINTFGLESGTYDVVTGVTNGCEGDVVEETTGTVTINPSQQPPNDDTPNDGGDDGVSGTPIGEPDELIINKTDELEDRGITSGASCDASTDLRVDGCQIASCVNNEIRPLDPNEVICESGSTIDEDEAGTIADEIDRRSRIRNTGILGSLGVGQGTAISLLIGFFVLLGGLVYFYYEDN